jgi:hypothetical protein
MKVKRLLFLLLLFTSSNNFAQMLNKIEATDGVHYIRHSNIEFPLLGTYLFKGKEPVVELHENGTGYYQSHDQPKRAMIWGIESDNHGVLQFKKGFDNAKYILWYQYTRSSDDVEADLTWKRAEFTIHYNSNKMYIQGERSKDFSPVADK